MRILSTLLVVVVAAAIPLQLRADPCGDVNVDSLVDVADIAAYQAALADPGGAGLSPAGEGNCTVIGPVPRSCGILDVAVMIRALDASPLGPGIDHLCASSLAACDVLNAAECMLPYPSTHYLEPAATATGFKLALTQASMPVVHPETSPAPYNEVDGFSPTVQILMHFPQGVDLVASGVSRLLLPMLGGPPWIDTRTSDASSTTPAHPSVLIDAGTGERILHWLELDARADGNPARQALVMRPGRSLVPGHRYIVAMRNLTAPGAAPVVAEAPFAALRDSVITADPAIEARRAYFDSDIFPVLTTNGITRSELVLAFDFIVQSEHQLTHQMLAMRDDAYLYTDALEADTGTLGFTVSSTTTHDCNVPGQTVWRDVAGFFDTPLYLTAVPTVGNTAQLNVDASDVPIRNGFMPAPFNISIPCSVHDGGVTSRPMILGHGLFGTGASMMGVPPAAGTVADWTYIAGATDWRGLSNSDFVWVAFQVVGSTNSKLDNFPAFPDRLRQGMANTLVLARLMKAGVFNRHASFQFDGGAGVFAEPADEMYYYGISLGGVMGTFLSALTPDIGKFGLDVPSINFSCLLQRSTQFGLGSPSFESLLTSIGLTDPMETILGVGLLHELWVGAEPAGYARHITSDPLAGSGVAKKIMMTPAWLDKQVSNQCTEISARTLGLVSHEGSLQQGLAEIPDSLGAQDSALIMYDTGAFDMFNPLHDPFIPPLANQIPSPKCDPHGDRPGIEAGVLQLVEYMQPGGQILNFCTGVCDAGNALESPAVICDPLLP